MSDRLAALCCALFGLLLAGCREKSYEAPSSGTYGAVTNAPSLSVSRARPDESASQPWTNGELAVIQTELSPATLYHSKSKALSVFAQMPETGLGGPTFAAISTEQGPKIFKSGERIDPARMRESWFVVWFAGANGWANWDSPWFVTLQHRPTKIRFDTNGLHFTFAKEAGYAALMPMYGSYKPLQGGQESSPFAQLKEKKKRVLTWEWHLALPADPLARARYWASALREFPVYCEDSFSIDRAHDSVTIQQSYRWLSWNDDWNTKHLKLAPVSPVLAHAYKEGFPAEFSQKPFDMETFTHYGPLYGIQEVDSYRVTLPVLRYVHETAGVGADVGTKIGAPCFQAWQKAHASGEWHSLEQRWPALRDEFRRSAGIHWPAFASAAGRPPLEQTANALGAARIAYRLGDMDTYVAASHVFARALVQLSAQQRGINYFREHQPWRSMEPLGPDAALVAMDSNGWRLGKRAPSGNFANAPDLVRVLRDSSPASQEHRLNSPAKVERLIPGGPATAFMFGEWGKDIPGNGLVQTVSVGRPEKAPDSAAVWPRIAWPDWKTPTGAPWNFGQVVTSSNAPASVESQVVNGNTSVLLLTK